MYCPEEFSSSEDAVKELLKSIESGQPATLRSAKVKLTARCNLRCYMCGYWKSKEKDRIDSERALSLVDELIKLKCRKVHFSGGEVLLRRDAPEIFTRAAEGGMRVNITTNATLIDKGLAKELARSGIRSVALSIDSAKAKIHDRMRGQKGAWNKSIKGIRLLHAARLRWNKKLKLRINTVVTRHNYKELSMLPQLLEDISPNQILLIPVDEKNNLRIGLNKTMIKEFNEKIAPDLATQGLEMGFFKSSADAYPFGRSAEEVSEASKGKYACGYFAKHLCWVPWLHTFVSADGSVYLCCMSRNRIEPIGNIVDEPLDEIFQGAEYAKRRAAMLKSRLTICHKCDNFMRENMLISKVPRLLEYERACQED